MYRNKETIERRGMISFGPSLPEPEGTGEAVPERLRLCRCGTSGDTE